MIWEDKMAEAIKEMLVELSEHQKYGMLSPSHTKKTPQRVVESYTELFGGSFLNPMDVLGEAVFVSDDEYGQMITSKEIPIFSMCAHHLLPFFGYATFSYIPNEWIVGLSKVPRFVDVLSRRPQIQEQLTKQIVDIFDSRLKPRGCGVMIRAHHLCNIIRGAKAVSAYTETTALRGAFLNNQTTKSEFLQTAQHTPVWGSR